MLSPTILFFLLALATSDAKECNAVENFILECSGITKADLPNNPNEEITWLRFENFKLHRLQRETLSVFPNLENFFAEKIGLVKIDNDAFKGLKKLDWINVSENNISEVDPDILTTAEVLNQLDISGNTDLTIPKSKPFLKSKSMTFLDLSSCKLREINTQTFEQLPSLNHLSLAKNHLTALPSNAFQKNPKLEWLNIEKNKFATLAPTAFSATPKAIVVFNDNPWNCDCHLTPLIMWAKDHHVGKDVKCVKPNTKNWVDITDLIMC